MKRLIYISTIIIVAGLGLLWMTLSVIQNNNSEYQVKDVQLICGTQTFYDESTSIGKNIFNTNCAACHQLNKRMTGPALKDVGRKYDSLTVIKFLHGERTLVINHDYENKCVFFAQLSDEDILSILAYTDN